MITEQQKIEVKEFAAIKPILYSRPPTPEALKADCAVYAQTVFPEWSAIQANYFHEMVKSYTKVSSR